MIRRLPSAPPRPFLTAEWRYLAMLNYEIDPAVLLPWVPSGTELDFWNGRTLVSIVGFQFIDTRVLGVAIPFHRNFAEVNLRFYVRRRVGDEWRRGVVFIKELVPRAAVSLTARLLYGENYCTVPIRQGIEFVRDDPATPSHVSYRWRFRGRESGIDLKTVGQAREVEPQSEEQFITEHYWGFTRRPGKATLEYLVEHPRWQVWPATSAHLDCDVERLYGRQFVEPLGGRPTSALLADGSKVTVYKGGAIAKVRDVS